MKYVVFSCTGTKELCIEARNTGFEDVWIPMQRIRVKPSQRNRAPYYKDVCPVVGYIYVPAAQAKAFKAWCPKKYNIKALLIYMAPPGSSGLVHSALVKYATVNLSELKEHDQAVKNQNKPAVAPTVANEYNKGDSVLVSIGDNQIPGVIDSFRGKNRARVLTSLGAVTADIERLSRAG